MGTLEKVLTDFLRNFESRTGDLLLNIRTHGAVYFDRSGFRRDYSDYETTAHTTVLKAIKASKPSECDRVFVIGSGKGRALCHFARLKLEKVVGIELSEQLCEQTRRNLETLRGKRSPVEIRNEDALKTDLDGATMFYMFNPFGPETMRAMLGRIASECDLSRGLKVIYLNPLCQAVFLEFPQYRISLEEKRLTGVHMIIYDVKQPIEMCVV